MTENTPLNNVTGNENELPRRDFLKIMGITTAAIPLAGFAGFDGKGVSLVVDPKDAITQTAPVQWAIAELETALKAKNIAVQHCISIDKANSRNLCITITGSASPLLKKVGNKYS